MAKSEVPPERKGRKERKKASKPAKTKASSKQGEGYGLAAAGAWLLLILACGLTLVPTLGFWVWFIAAPIVLAAIVLSVIVMRRGGKIQGGILLALSLIGAPLFILSAPPLSATAGVPNLLSIFRNTGDSVSGSKAKQSAANSKSVSRPRPVAPTPVAKRPATTAKAPESRSESSRPKIDVLAEKNAPD